VPWIRNLSFVAKSGHIQTTLISLCLAWTVTGAWRRRHFHRVHPAFSTIKSPWRYELVSQLARASSLTCITTAAILHESQWLNVTIVGFAFLLGLVRLAHLQWRHALLHQVNILLAAAWLLLGFADFFPLLDLKYDGAPTAAVLSAFGALTVALVVAAATPREWAPPTAPDNIKMVIPDAKPSPEETCSWLECYLTYGWLNPLMRKGWSHRVKMEDLPPQPSYNDPVLLLHQVVNARGHARRTLRTILHFMGKEIAVMCICELAPKYLGSPLTNL